jgi:hypothetical protein
MTAHAHIPDADLQTALAYAARLAAARGRDVPAFVQAFERLEALAAERQRQESAIERARRLAGMV